ESIAAGLKCPQAARFKGKLLITSYGADGLPPAQWKEMLAALRKQHGDTFLFLPSVTAPVRFRQDYDKGLPFDEEEMEKTKARLREWLDVCDGIYFNYPAAFKLYENRRKFDDGFYRDLFIPVFKSVLAEPKYQGKLLGLSAYHSHYNADISLGLQEDNTKTLRRSVEAALEARPEVIILPEWDEQNENTSFRPTVCNSLSTMRILRYYMAGQKGQPLSPMDGDDPDTPNLVVSFRKALVLGEELEIELLNIPDSTYAGPYQVTVRLLDPAGKQVAAFAPAKMDGSRLHDVTLKLGTEALAACAAVRPEVRVTGWRGKDSVWLDGLHHIRLRAGSNWDYKYVKLPLRDQLRPAKAAFALQVKDGCAVVTGEVTCDTPIAYVEALEDDDVAWAMDPANEFMQDTPGVKRFCVEYRHIRVVPDKLTISVDRPALKWFSNAAILHQQPDSLSVAESAVVVETAFSPHVRWSVFAIKDADAAAGVVSLATTTGQASVKLADVLARGPWAHVFPNGLCVTVSEREKPLDLPRHLDTPSAKVVASFRPQSPDRVIHVRVIAKNGKIWRGAPMPLPFAGGDLKDTTLRVYSAATDKPADVKVAAGRIASFAYEFTPERGDVLWASPRHEFSGALAGFVDSLTLQGGNGGYSSSQFAGGFAGRAYLDGPVSFAPKWAVVDSRPCLVFDGKGAFVSLPCETVPRHGSFVMEFEIKPEAVPTGKGRQFVFSHRLIRPNSLSVFLANGRINAEYSMEGHGMAVDDEGLPIEAGKWSKVRVTRDFENLTLEVDGKGVTTPCPRPGFDIGPMSFGGFGRTPDAWFKGCLAGVKITHNSAR
ncbi:MAG TPA: laminin G domain-containing protein, partial [Candidatus Brocadiia bacterium]|nr:laminin G domain-containing protein [Candidatus Brocadiia bacterium]